MEKSFFVEVFGDYPLIRVLDFLLTFREFDYPLTEIAENSGVGWSTIHSFWHRLVEMGIVIQTRQVGRAKLYKLNIKNPVVHELIRLDSMITKHFTNLILKEETSIKHSPPKS
jgi:DNA-binding transcriptional ArsR family regulator